MGKATALLHRAGELVRGAERHWLRPVLQGLRIPRFRRGQSRRPSAATEELLVALLRARARADGAVGGILSDRPVDERSDADVLVRGLLSTVPDGTASDRAPAEVMAFPGGSQATASSMRARRRAA